MHWYSVRYANIAIVRASVLGYNVNAAKGRFVLIIWLFKKIIVKNATC
jgi:hypothetical protein